MYADLIDMILDHWVDPAGQVEHPHRDKKD
jgi:hypothetical protein